MSLNKEFIELLPIEIERQHGNVLLLREYLIKYKNKGIDKDSMLENLEELRKRSNFKTEDILLELMDFVVGYCNSNLSIF